MTERKDLEETDGSRHMSALGKKIEALAGLVSGPVARKMYKDIEAGLKVVSKHLSVIEGQATTDYLTGLFNRQSFDEFMVREQGLVSRNDRPSSLVYLDIDRLKLVNDNYGHLAGDEVLRGIARIIKEHEREGGDISCRYGGDEFCVILPETGMDGAYSYAKRLRGTIADREWVYDGKNLGRVTISAGVSVIHTWESVEDIVNGVDKAMYKAKGNGRNRVVLRGN